MTSALRDSLEIFAAVGARAALIGGIAMAAHGCPRSTLDVDWLLERTAKDPVREALAARGYRTLQDTPEVLCMFAEPAARVDCILAHRRTGLTMLADAVPMTVLGTAVSVLRVEDLIGLKAQAMLGDPKRRALDLADIRALAERHRASIDVARVERYYELLGARTEWDALWAEVSRG